MYKHVCIYMCVCVFRIIYESKAYIPLRRKTTGVGANANFCVGGPTQHGIMRWQYQHFGI